MSTSKHELIDAEDSRRYRWLMEDADRAAQLIADAYSGWDTDDPWREWVSSMIDAATLAIRKDAEVEWLRAENERLRAALEGMLKAEPIQKGDLIDMARAALKGDV